MDDNKVKWTRKVRRYLRDAFSWLDTGLMLNALLIMDITFAGCFGMMQWRYNKEIGELEDMACRKGQVWPLRVCAYERRQSDRRSISPLLQAGRQQKL